MATPETSIVTLSSSSPNQSTADNAMAAATETPPPLLLPRITIKFCTQCKWMLRAAYRHANHVCQHKQYAQELLSTFSTALGEVALQPSTGGTFVVQILSAGAGGLPHTLWDRKVDGGFPETKELKRRVRDVIEPGRNLGHVDRDYPRPDGAAAIPNTTTAAEHVSARASGGSAQEPLGKQDPGSGAAGSRGTDEAEVGKEKGTCDDCN
ncbi:hypothetical protein PpBr36_00477 [Pyricularia pennisetigena]|uniref:hypothetical protein n=1 Tax=Pyricularia pennisetigena TaxID=1578925 RepID=UPI001154F31A|nr:hypothetical protein PpBr36_00477 [Pyricularia pennisetigena]TLS29687.1 hypothetical protein PpBr36_00477 [Pyricularia pennisetigena]